MSNFHLIPQDKREELCSLLPQVDQTTLLDHHSSTNYDSLILNNPAYNQPSFFSKVENPIFWNSLTEWQTMLAQGQFMDQADSPPLPLSPSPPTNSSSNKSTASSSYTRTKSTSNKDKFKVVPIYTYNRLISNA
jgi:hypothetical protein